MYPALPPALQQRWDQAEQDLADELITAQVRCGAGTPSPGHSAAWSWLFPPPPIPRATARCSEHFLRTPATYGL